MNLPVILVHTVIVHHYCLSSFFSIYISVLLLLFSKLFCKIKLDKSRDSKLFKRQTKSCLWIVRLLSGFKTYCWRWLFVGLPLLYCSRVVFQFLRCLGYMMLITWRSNVSKSVELSGSEWSLQNCCRKGRFRVTA